MKFRTERERRRYEEAKVTYAMFIKVYDFQLDDLLDEKWLPIPDYEDYQESNYGRTKSFHNGKVIILKPSLDGSGYLTVCLHKGGKLKTFHVARLVATLFIPNPDNKPEVNHIYSRFSNHVDCIEWATSVENKRHAVATGLVKSGENSPDAKLANEQVVYIRENPDGLNIYELGDLFGVKPQTISRIQLGKRYKQAGGTIRGKIDTRIPDELKAQICAEYVYGSAEFGTTALAKKYGVSTHAILRIVKEQL